MKRDDRMLKTANSVDAEGNPPRENGELPHSAASLAEDRRHCRDFQVRRDDLGRREEVRRRSSVSLQGARRLLEGAGVR